jgi:AcrR family transcriptional regulator
MRKSEMADLVLPAKQVRSRLRRDRLLAAGRKLLNQGAFEDTSIGDFARVADCSVGVFYQRFADKEAFFAAVVETVLTGIAADARQFVTAELLSGPSIELVLAECVTFWVRTFRRHRGFIRTLMKTTLHTEEAWTPFREMGRVAVEPFVALLSAKCGQANTNAFRYRARVGFQIVIGVALNASLHRTVLLNLDSDELIAWATETLRHCLFDELPMPLANGSGTRASQREPREPPSRRSLKRS